jgi:type VI protein secretion system component Hcp
MANKVFLELLGVVGSSQDPDFPNAIELLSFSWSGDPRKISEITIVKAVDIASPALLQKAASGDTIRSGTITFVTVNASTGKVPFLKYKMTNIVIASYQLGGGDTPTESIALHFDKVEVQTIAPVPTGLPDFLTSVPTGFPFLPPLPTVGSRRP